MPKEKASTSAHLQTTEVPLADLKTWEANPRIITDANFRRLCSLLKRKPSLLWKNPIHANKDGTVYSGNMRYRAAQALAWEKIPCVLSPVQMSEEDMKEEAIILNHHHGEDQKDELAQQLYDLDEAGIDVYALGVQETVVNTALDAVNLQGLKEEDEDDGDIEVPKSAKDARTKEGDKWQLGDHIVLCGDARKIEDVEILMEGAVADMVFTDPPYNVDYTGKTKDALKIENDSMNNSEYMEFLRDFMTNLNACTKEGGGLLYLPRRFRRAQRAPRFHRIGLVDEAVHHLGEEHDRHGAAGLPMAARTDPLRLEGRLQALLARRARPEHSLAHRQTYAQRGTPNHEAH